MTTLHEARALALALPDVEERDHHGRASFRVGGRIFATVWDPEHLNVMVDEPGIHSYVARDPEVYAEVSGVMAARRDPGPGPHRIHRGWSRADSVEEWGSPRDRALRRA